jgi:DNA mismatch endonuclease (patch repair protein)
MVDVVDKATRSRMMAGIGGRNTSPELLIRSLLHKGGYRFRLHRKDLPAKPDIVLPKYGAVILVHGCFWHGHRCHMFKWPKSNQVFWRTKILANVKRDRRSAIALNSSGWRLMTVWECALRGPRAMTSEVVFRRISSWLNSRVDQSELSGKMTR